MCYPAFYPFSSRGWFTSGSATALPGPSLSTMDSGSGDKDRSSADKWSLFGPRSLQKSESGKAPSSLKKAAWRAFDHVCWYLPTGLEIICSVVYFCRRLCHPSLQRSPETFSNGSDARTSHPKGGGASNVQAAQDGYPSYGRDETAATGPQPQTPGLECSHTHWLLEFSVPGTLHQGYRAQLPLPWL